jgi:hypothetical protein
MGLMPQPPTATVGEPQAPEPVGIGSLWAIGETPSAVAAESSATAEDRSPLVTAVTTRARSEGTTEIVAAATAARLAQPSPPTRSREENRYAARPLGRGRSRHPADHVDVTKVAAERPDARDGVETASRAPTRLALALLALGMTAAALLAIRAITAPAMVPVPNLRGLSGRALLTSLRRSGLHAAFSRRYAAAPVGVAVSQSPAAGSRTTSGSVVSVVLSRGAPPVEVPRLVGQSMSTARAILGSLHLSTVVQTVPAPGTSPGTVTGQRPGAGSYLAQHKTVTLLAAEVPQWRTVTSFTGTDGGASVPFRIRGERWRAVYSMSYVGTCTFILFCDGPGANVVNPSSGATVSQFGLNEGSGQTDVLNLGPGVYEVKITPGMDSAQWSMAVQDYY